MSDTPSDDSPDTVLVVDLGAQYAQLIARRIREAHVYSEIVPRDITAEEIKERRPTGVILSGGPASVYSEDAYRVDPGIFDSKAMQRTPHLAELGSTTLRVDLLEIDTPDVRTRHME